MKIGMRKKRKLLSVLLGGSFFCLSKYAGATDYTTTQFGPQVFNDGDTVNVTTSTSDWAVWDGNSTGTGTHVAGNGAIQVNYNTTRQQAYAVYLSNNKANDLGTGSVVKSNGVGQAYGISVMNAGTAFKANQLNVNVNSQKDAWGIHGGFSAIDLGQGSKITTTINSPAANSATGLSTYQGSVNADQLMIDVSGTGYFLHGANSNNGKGTINFGSNSVINVKGTGTVSQAVGLYADGSGNRITGNHMKITTESGNNALSYARTAGIFSRGSESDRSIVDLGNQSEITVNASRGVALGLWMMGGNDISMNQGTITVNASDTTAANGVLMAQNGNKVDLGSDTTLVVNSAGSPGVGIQMNGTGNTFLAKGLSISGTNMDVGVKVDGANSRVEITEGSKIITNGSGVFVNSSNSSALVKDTEINIHHLSSWFGSFGGLQTWGTNALIEAERVSISSDTDDYALGMIASNQGVIRAKDVSVDIQSGDGAFSLMNGSLIDLQGDTHIYVNPDSDDRAIIAANQGRVTGAGKMDIRGQVNAVSNGIVDLDMTAGSYFYGSTNNSEYGGTLNLKMTDSQWEMYSPVSGNSYVSALALDNSTVNFRTLPSSYQTLNVQDLNGNGSFEMRTDMAAGEGGAAVGSGAIGLGGGDLLNMTGTVHGNFLLDIENQGAAPSNSSYEHLVVQTADGSGNFDLTHKVEVGAYEYDLHRDSSNSNNWSLFRTEELTPAAVTVMNEPRAAYYLGYGEMQTLIQRMGDIRNNEESGGNVWAKLVFGKNEVDGTSQLSGFSQNYGGVQAGVDKKIEWKNGNFYQGIFAGYTDGNNDFKFGSGDIKSRYVGVYGTYIGDNHFYVDGALKFGTMDQQVRVFDTAGNLVRGDYSTKGFTGSLEVGQRLFFKKKEDKGFYIEPQAQMNWGYQSGDRSTLSNGLIADVGSYHTLLGRVGFLVGYEVKGGKNPINVYGKLSYNHEFAGGYSSNMNGAEIAGDLSGSWWTYGVGVTAQISQKHNIYLDFERSSGNGFAVPWKMDVGYRFQW